jgi:phage-related protein
MTFDELLRWAGSSVITGGIEDVELASKDLTYELTQMGATLSLVTAPGISNMNASFTEAGGSVANLIPSTNLLTSSLMNLPVQPVNQNVSQLVYTMKTWEQQTIAIGQSFLQMAQIIGGSIGSALAYVGTLTVSFGQLGQGLANVGTMWHAVTSGFSNLSSLSGISGLMSGISGLMGLAGSAISIFGALGSASKRAFTDEEEELVAPNRAIFYDQFVGADTDPFTALGNSINRAAMMVYGIDWDTAWTQYGAPLTD